MQTNSANKLSTDARLLKQINYVRILGLLRRQAGLSRADIARQTGLTRSTVTVITAELIADELIREGATMASQPGGGRPGVELELNPEGAFFIGAEIEVDHLKVVELESGGESNPYPPPTFDRDSSRYCHPPTCPADCPIASGEPAESSEIAGDWPNHSRHA